MPQDSVIAKCKPGGALERTLSLGHLEQTESLRCGRGRSLRLLGWRSTRLCSLSFFLVRSHALFQPEHLAHSSSGESKWATPVGGECTNERDRDKDADRDENTEAERMIRWGLDKLLSKVGKWANKCRGHLSQDCKQSTGGKKTGRTQPLPHPRVLYPCWPSRSCTPLQGGASKWVAYRSLFLSVVTSRFMDSADSVTSSSSRCSRLRPACARDASSSASSSCLLSCFSRRLLFSSCVERSRSSLWCPRAYCYVSTLHSPTLPPPCLSLSLHGQGHHGVEQLW